MARMTRKTIHTLEQDNDKAHFSKKYMQVLRESYIYFGDKRFDMPVIVKKNDVARAKWIEIMRLYKKYDHLDLVTSADIGLVARYALMFADYQLLLEAKRDIDAVAKNAIENSELCNKQRLDTKINAKAKLLLAMETELFLTPLSKSRAVPRDLTPKKKTDLEKKGFNLG